jgi:AraC family transcriptional regulator of adaptative response/methylated-DNA-[protein]-cysteine methyltransferase
MERAYLAGDPAYDGLFFLGVRTTGIFCRPTCPARKALPQHVEYFADAAGALRAGYRPCRRCRPLDAVDQPAWAARLLGELEEDPGRRITDGDLRARGLDPGAVRRHFRRRFGLTFQEYARGLRLGRARSRLQSGDPVDEAVFESGYDSHSGFREAFSRLFGGPPTSVRRADAVAVTWLPSPIGPLVAGATARGVCLLEFGAEQRLEGQVAAVRRDFGLPVFPGGNEHLERLRSELEGYFAGTTHRFFVPLDLRGTPFQRRVWTALLSIPYGETRSYQDVAAAIGRPAAVRAVGRANGSNRIAIVVPCHRVVNKSGALGGYGGGLRRKEYLLGLERARGPAPVRRE